MDVPLSEFNSLDLERELYARVLNTDGSKQECFGRLLAARQAEAQAPNPRPPRRASIAKFGARVQLDDFAEIQMYKQAEFDLLSGKVRWRLERVRRTEDGEGLEYFHPDVLSRVQRSHTYMLNMDELLVRQEPYIHKVNHIQFTYFLALNTLRFHRRSLPFSHHAPMARGKVFAMPEVWQNYAAGMKTRRNSNGQ